MFNYASNTVALPLNRKVKVLHYGLGPIGCSIAELAVKKGLEPVGAIDISPKITGKDLGSLIGSSQKIGVTVSDDPIRIIRETKPDVVLHATGSSLSSVLPQLEELLEHGCNIISTCEELAYPWRRYSRIASKLDRSAKKQGVRLLGTGVNPGFVMDSMVLALTGACQHVEKIEVSRIVDASTRRLPLQKKIGSGMSVKEFEVRVKKSTIGHVGLIESAEMICGSLGVELEEVKQTIIPVIAKRNLKTKYLEVAPGKVCGIDQRAIGVSEGISFVDLKLQMFIGASDPLDRIVVKGTPNLEMLIPGGVPGDVATAAIIINSIPRVLEARPGLLTVKDIAVPSALLGEIALNSRRNLR